MKSRLKALDGLRGLAILAVVLTHIPTETIFSSIPSKFHFILTILFRSGGIGVYVFFLLTGFLMGWLYPKPLSALSFWGKRYARLFPPFLVMVVSFTIIRLAGKLSLFTELFIILTTAFIARGVWELCLKINEKIPIGKWLLISFLLFQLGIAVWYSFFLLRVPPAVFYQVWNPKAQDIITGLVNATLTLPFGNYIGQLDGVYWTLASEVLFYLLYPILFVPFLHFLKSVRSIKLKSFLFLLLLPFCFGIYLTNLRILGFEILKLHLIIYFIVGVIIGLNVEWFRQKAEGIKAFFHPVLLVAVLLGVFGHLLLYSTIPRYYHSWVQILIIFPASLLLLMTIVEQTIASRLLGQKIFTFLGKYSYSLYLTHAFVIQSVGKFISPNNIASTVLLGAISISGSVFLSMILFHLIEAPYFNLRKKAKSKTSKQYSIVLKEYSKKVVVIFTTTVLALLYIAYKPPFATFSSSFRHVVPSFWQAITSEKVVPIRENPIQQKFTAIANNFGMITIHVRNRIVAGVDVPLVKSRLIMRLRSIDGEVIAESSYDAFVFIDSYFHPFGFPIQTDSKGKEYILEYELSKANPAQEVELVTNEGSFLSIYFPNKKDLLKNPSVLVKWIIAKFLEPFSNPIFWFTLLHIVPLLLVLIGVLKLLSTSKSQKNRG